ncbi:hypothetical protein DFP94_101914 [Fontibacillus phaseoli]|uniref:Uncharacterized protein n=1 Tax=Fontibacillus phaseoli TaxID=1416533 RepID=A0A369BSB4_9BACL|nr:hypothetical protein [Fontibacillus phaseoli]RCX23317.1 hypothetical protein DFP94_101914 [Fontibacillus phaseoli]
MKDADNKTEEMWRKYILGELNPERSDKLDQLLQDDDTMFQVYIKEFMATQDELPALLDEERFADSVLSALPAHARNRIDKRRRRRWQNPLLHYVIAASITLLLLGGGVFDLLSAGANAAVQRQSADAPLSDRLMKRATQWMEKIKPSNNP